LFFIDILHPQALIVGANPHSSGKAIDAVNRRNVAIGKRDDVESRG